LSGAILGFLPIGFFLFLSVTSRRDIAPAYHSSTGATAIVAGLLMQGAAFLWIRRLLRVEG
jgi:Flp pilus assembly protein TadB